MRDFERLVAEYLAASVEQAERMRALAQAARPEDLGALRQWAHRLRGSGQSFGFPEITRIAGRIEDLAVAALAGDAAAEAPLVPLCDELLAAVARARLTGPEPEADDGAAARA
jgi:HPt (histidine-containing phosphotransfer) domain-containing protein